MNYKNFTLITADSRKVIPGALFVAVKGFSSDGHDYIALLPLDEKGENHDGEVWIYGHEEDAEGNPSLRYIDDEEEYEKASDAFDEYLDGQEFDELLGDEEEGE